MPRNNPTTEAINYLLIWLKAGQQPTTSLLVHDDPRQVPKVFTKPFRSLANSIKLRHLCEYMVEQGLIRQTDRRYSITPKGTSRIPIASQEWDGKWRILLISSKATKNNARKRFVHQLKRLGMTRLQNGVWMTRENVETEVTHLAALYGVEAMCTFVLADRLTSSL
jgi:hypothetical protein